MIDEECFLHISVWLSLVDVLNRMLTSWASPFPVYKLNTKLNYTVNFHVTKVLMWKWSHSMWIDDRVFNRPNSYTEMIC